MFSDKRSRKLKPFRALSVIILAITWPSLLKIGSYYVFAADGTRVICIPLFICFMVIMPF
jgi:hypothetical protein